MESVPLFTIGFTKKTAEQFFTLLRQHEVARVIDVRLNNTSQLTRFSKQDDLPFFLGELCGAGYQHRPECAPEKELLGEYKSGKVSWEEYIPRFIPTLTERRIESFFDREMLDHACLLCSEAEAETCHRSLVAEYLKGYFPELEIIHL